MPELPQERAGLVTEGCGAREQGFPFLAAGRDHASSAAPGSAVEASCQMPGLPGQRKARLQRSQALPAGAGAEPGTPGVFPGTGEWHSWLGSWTLGMSPCPAKRGRSTPCNRASALSGETS